MNEMDKLLTREGIDLSYRPQDDMYLCCEYCGCWYSEDTAPLEFSTESDKVLSGIKTEYFCSCHEEHKKLLDAYSLHINTPSMEWEINALEGLIDRYENKIKEVKEYLSCYNR